MDGLKRVNFLKPYIFVSYANADNIQVLSDVIRLQQEGINVWIDSELQRYTGRSWKKVVFQAMKNPNCKAVLFFISKFSLMSDAVKYELDTTRDLIVKGTHYQKDIPILPIEVTTIDNIMEFCNSLAEECALDEIMVNSELPDEDEYIPSENVIYIRENFFSDNSIMRYRIFDKENIKKFLETLSQYGVQCNDKFIPCQQDLNLLMKEGRRFRKLGMLQDAFNSFKKAALAGSVEAYVAIGYLNEIMEQMSVHQYKQAESCFIRAIDLHQMPAKLGLAILYYNGCEYRKARKILGEIQNSKNYLNSIKLKNTYNQLVKSLSMYGEK